MCFSYVAVAQEESEPFTCFNAQEIKFPLAKNDFSKSQILMNENKVNALYYLYQDKYSFWYKFVAVEKANILFSVSPSNDQDRYRALVFKYGGSDFCDKLVNENLKPIEVSRSPIFKDEGKIVYRNSIEAAAGDTFYISVLSLNQDDCGHFLYVESGESKLSMHAIHRPCYNFVLLEIPDFEAVRQYEEDVELELEFEKPGLTETEAEKDAPIPDEKPKNEEPLPESEDKSGFKSIETIEIQSADNSIVSVGDRLILNKVYFYSNTYAFKPGAEEELNELVNFLLNNPTVEVEIQGHTANDTEDIRPDPNFKGQGKEWNFKGSAFELSQKRAEAVRDYLIENGVSKKRLAAEGYGDTVKRIPDAKTFEEFEKNMRVEAVVTRQ